MQVETVCLLSMLRIQTPNTGLDTEWVLHEYLLSE